MTQPSFRDIEQISTLLDGKLDSSQAAKLEARLASDPELAAVYEELSQARALLRRVPQRRAPRNFTLKPAAARVRPPLPRLFPTFRLASVLASLLLFYSLATNATLPRLAGMANAEPAYMVGMGGAPEMDRVQGGGGGDTESAQLPIGGGLDEPPAEEAVEAPAAAAPLIQEEPAASEPADPKIAAEPEAELVAEDSLEAEAAPLEETAPAAVESELPPAPIPGWVVATLGLLSLLSGGLAYFLRWRNDHKWQEQAGKK